MGSIPWPITLQPQWLQIGASLRLSRAQAASSPPGTRRRACRSDTAGEHNGSHLLEADDGEATIAAIRSPLLAFFGARELGGEAALETIRRQARAAARVDAEVIEDADHVYTSHEADVANMIARWMATLI